MTDIDDENLYKYYLIAHDIEMAFQKRARDYLLAAHKESDLGLVLLTVSLLDEYLIKILTSFFVPDKHSFNLVAYEHSPIGNLKTRIDLTYALGLISTDEFKVMNTLRKIRNIFAHKGIGVSFKTDSIRDLVSNIFLHSQLENDAPIRQKYIIAFGLLLELLDERYSGALDDYRERPELPDEIIQKHKKESSEIGLAASPSSQDDQL